MSETNTILGVSNTITLSAGLKVNIKPLKTIELFKFMKIISSSGALAIQQFRLNGEMTNEQFATRMLGLLIFAIPQAEEETLEFIRAMVEPVGLLKPARNKQDKDRNETLWIESYQVLENPEPEDTIAIIEKILETEAGHIQSLGKQIMKLIQTIFPNLKLTQKSPEPQEPNIETSETTSSETPDMNDSTPMESSVDSPQPSTSSPAAMAGRTKKSSS